MHQALLGKLIAVVLGMFAFGFLLVPLYDVFCEVTGLNGKTNTEAALPADYVDTSRYVTVEFVTHDPSKQAWQLQPAVQRVKVHPGAPTQIEFWLDNNMATAKVAQAVPSVAPFAAAKYLHKIECFCFEQQPVAAGKRVALPVMFYVDRELPQSISTLTLSYTLYDITAQAGDKLAQLGGSNESIN